ncbi:unnamed protein product [Ectocarpus sp. 12 AP-2014]
MGLLGVLHTFLLHILRAEKRLAEMAPPDPRVILLPKTFRTLHRFYKRYNGIAVVLAERNLGPYLASSSRSCGNRASFPTHSAAWAPCSPSFNRAKPINRALFRSTATAGPPCDVQNMQNLNRFQARKVPSWRRS